MANINKSVVIQLADCGIIDIVTEFDEQYTYGGSDCPSCGPDEYYVRTQSAIQSATIFTTVGTRKIVFWEKSDYESYTTDGEVKNLSITESDLIRLLLDTTTLKMLEGYTLKEFCRWLTAELYAAADRRWYERGNDL